MSAGRSGGLTWTEGPVQLSQPFAFVPQPDPDRQPYVAPHHAFIVLDTIEDGGGAVGRLSAIASMPAAYDVAIDEGVSVDIAPGAGRPQPPVEEQEPVHVGVELVQRGLGRGGDRGEQS